MLILFLPLLSDQFYASVYRPGNDGLFSNLYDRALKKIRVLDHRLYHLTVWCLVRKTEFFIGLVSFSCSLDRPDTRLLKELLQMVLGQRVGKVIYTFKIYFVLTERCRKLAAGRSRRLLVDRYLSCHYLIPILW